MELSFNWLKEYAQKNDQYGSSIYSTVIKLIKEFCDEEKIIFFYPKSYRNPDKMEYILFFDNGYMCLRKENQEYKLKRYYCNVLSKAIVTTKFIDNIELVVNYDNGQQLIFNNQADSSFDMEEVYSRYIKELNKVV
ncbi:hypothetical protein ABXS71_16895 [Bacillus infantis]|uniref:hypothetical protein n=1 Tax=Bacillus infantis TaxID=324767 RepID=UPI00344DC0AE